MAIKIIGKSALGELGFSQNVSHMGDQYHSQLEAIRKELPSSNYVICTSMTGFAETKATNGEYFPKIRLFSDELYSMFDPMEIYNNCCEGLDPLRPGCDFIVWNPKHMNIAAITFSREAPILAFESDTGKKALGVILRPALMKHGDYLFSTIQKALGGEVKATLVTCNHYAYPEGSIPSIIWNLAAKHGMHCEVWCDSEKEPECYHRGETGNHVVAMW